MKKDLRTLKKLKNFPPPKKIKNIKNELLFLSQILNLRKEGNYSETLNNEYIGRIYQMSS